MTERRIRKLLIANRGEIARRVQRTAHAMGLSTVAVFSDADSDALFVREADEAVRIGRSPSVESYLRIDRILEAAARTGADAVHPGYGFLSENHLFARACEEADLLFVGPSPDAIEQMGSKQQAKRIAQAAGVPVVPGYDGADQDGTVLAREAERVGFPVLLKASAGGGGKGMRIVRDAASLPAAIEGARREAESAFGDGTLLVERYVDRPRHVEFQILGDRHGAIVHLFERECSVQRRHQKVLEECPSPALTPAMREEMGSAAVAVARAIGYHNAGTVELLLAPDGAFYFLEVNTRLQVEHPVTELVTGLDLVREQIRLACGEPLGYAQRDVVLRGAAVEVRLYAEDPSRGFLPQSGRVLDYHVPAQEGLRVDGGVEAGSDVSIHYDPLLAKVVAHGASRAEALQRLRRGLGGLSVQGLRTNRGFLLDLLDHPALIAGDLDTHFIDTHLREVLEAPAAAEVVARAAVVATLAGVHERRRAMPGPAVPIRYRNNPFADARVEYEGPTGPVVVTYAPVGPGRFSVRVDDGEPAEVALVRCELPEVVVEDGAGTRRCARVVLQDERCFVSEGAASVELGLRPRFPVAARARLAGGCRAPMPGKIVKVAVQEGQAVDEGALLLVMEAMKMEHEVRAPSAGVVERLLVAAGDQVDADAVLAVVQPGT